MTRLLLPLLLLAALPALAQTPGSNIGLSQYPAPSCQKPQDMAAVPKPAPPPENLTETQAINYNKQVEAYNAAMRAYNEQAAAYTNCINTYIANGNADMGRIRAALDAAVAQATAR